MQAHEVFNLSSQSFERIDLVSFDRVDKNASPFYYSKHIWYAHDRTHCYIQHGATSLLICIRADNFKYDSSRNETNLVSITDYIKELDLPKIRAQIGHERKLRSIARTNKKLLGETGTREIDVLSTDESKKTKAISHKKLKRKGTPCDLPVVKNAHTSSSSNRSKDIVCAISPAAYIVAVQSVSIVSPIQKEPPCRSTLSATNDPASDMDTSLPDSDAAALPLVRASTPTLMDPLLQTEESPVSSIASPFSNVNVSMIEQCDHVDTISDDMSNSKMLCSTPHKNIDQLYQTFLDMAHDLCTQATTSDMYYHTSGTIALKNAFSWLTTYSFAAQISVVSCKKLATLAATMSSVSHKHSFVQMDVHHRSEMWIKPLCMFAFLNYAYIHKLSGMRIVLYEPTSTTDLDQLRADPLGFKPLPTRILGLTEDVFDLSKVDRAYTTGSAVVCLLLVGPKWDRSNDWSFVKVAGINHRAISLHNPSALLPLGFVHAYDIA